MFVALTRHLIQSTMRCENCIDSVDIDSIECIRDPCLGIVFSSSFRVIAKSTTKNVS